jgi:hypothetical protein
MYFTTPASPISFTQSGDEIETLGRAHSYLKSGTAINSKLTGSRWGKPVRLKVADKSLKRDMPDLRRHVGAEKRIQAIQTETSGEAN